MGYQPFFEKLGALHLRLYWRFQLALRLECLASEVGIGRSSTMDLLATSSITPLQTVKYHDGIAARDTGVEPPESDLLQGVDAARSAVLGRHVATRV